MIDRDVIDAGAARSLSASVEEAVAIHASMTALGAEAIYAVFNVNGQTSVERRVEQVQHDFLGRYQFNDRGVEKLGGRMAVDACAIFMPGGDVLQGMAVWLLPEVSELPQPQQLVLPLDLFAAETAVAHR